MNMSILEDPEVRLEKLNQIKIDCVIQNYVSLCLPMQE